MENEKLFEALAEIFRRDYYGTYLGKMYTPTEVKLLCIDAIMYYRKHEGDDSININDYFKENGLS